MGIFDVGLFNADDLIECYRIHREERLKKNGKVTIPITEGFEFVDEKGNVIDSSTIVIREKIKNISESDLPKTYEECCEIMKCAKDIFFTTYDVSSMENDGGYLYKQIGELTTLLKLKICRDVYWHIAGWKPDWENYEKKYTIYNYRGSISDDSFTVWDQTLLVFPTEEMRDAFYNNFRKEIFLCKEYLG